MKYMNNLRDDLEENAIKVTVCLDLLDYVLDDMVVPRDKVVEKIGRIQSAIETVDGLLKQYYEELYVNINEMKKAPCRAATPAKGA